MHNIEIYYFSGTGNSLHVAKELQKRIPEIKLIPIIASLDNVITTNAQTVGFVFPTYLTSVPAPIRKFINQLDLKSSTYTFSIVTRIGTFCTANTFTKKALEKQGKTLDASFMINMANNSPTGLRPIADKKWINKIEKEKIDGSPKWLKIRVFEENEKGKKTKVNINVPIAIVETGLKIGKGFDDNLDSALNGVDFNDIMDMIRSGAEGKIVDIYDEDSKTTVEVFVE